MTEASVDTDDRSQHGRSHPAAKIPGWPVKPMRLQVFDASTIWSIVADVAMLLLSVAFSVLGATAWWLHGRTVEHHNWGHKVKSISRLGPTIFPLLFAALAGRSFKVFGRFMARRGTRLGTLEAITSSQSLWSTFECQLRLQQASSISILLVLLWCLSPLGGQASLRVLEEGQSTFSTAVPIRYRSTGPASSIFASLMKGNDMTLAVATSSSARAMAQQEDHFGDVKIPRWEALNASITDDGWRAVPSVLWQEDYSSMLGLRVIGVPQETETRFNLESSYISTECGSFVQLPYSLNFTRVDVERMSRHFGFDFTATAAAGLLPGKNAIGYLPDNIQTFFVDTDRSLNLDRWKAYLGWHSLPAADAAARVAGRRRRLVFGSLKALDNGRRHAISLTNCSVLEMRVESAVYCPRSSASGVCRVEKMRLSRTDTRPPAVTLFDHHELAATIPRLLSQSNPGRATVSSGAERFLQWGKYADRVLRSPVFNVTGRTPVVDLALVSPRDFSRRLGILINTFYQHLISSNDDAPFADHALYRNVSVPATDVAMFGAPPPPERGAMATRHDFERYYNATKDSVYGAVSAGLAFPPAATTATATTRTRVYVCQFVWLGALLLASAALFVTGAASLALQLRSTLAPDMLRYVSSMTYTNRFFRTPPGGTTLDGMARARLLRDVHVRIGVITSGDGAEVGAAAFVATDNIATCEVRSRRRRA